MEGIAVPKYLSQNDDSGTVAPPSCRGRRRRWGGGGNGLIRR